MKTSFKVLPLIASLAAVSAFAQTPAEITPPAGNKAAMTLSATGILNYECKAVADKPGTFAWTFAGPDAKLWDANKKEVGKYYGGPTWESTDGSKVTGKQLAVSPSVAGAIPLQLVQAAPTTGTGASHCQPAIARASSDQIPHRCRKPFGACPPSPTKNGPTAKFTHAAANNTTSGKIKPTAFIRC